jgi:hypothetical protein
MKLVSGSVSLYMTDLPHPLSDMDAFIRQTWMPLNA